MGAPHAAFRTVLVANRGEIALRIQRTARRLGMRTVAVYSDADRDAPHCRAADLALPIGVSQPQASYLNIAALLEAARKSGAQAVHPGYGFLAESDAFANACAEAGLVFIGPPAEAILAMGNKAGAKRLMEAAGVPCVPGYQGEDQSDPRMQQEAERIGYPVMIKAAAGGGGRGMRRVDRAEDFAAALQSARSEAENAFASGELILEKAIIEPRHIEIQVFADTHGNVVHLGERDCSVQRRHQKVIEESPSPAVSPELRARMGAVSVAAARAIGYVGAGTLEFLLASDGAFYFMEMNTRLQVEHPVTEMITGEDLVEWQLRVASGEPLPRSQDELHIHGHALEARIYAENPDRDFLPSIGTLKVLRTPTAVEFTVGAQANGEPAAIRIDAGVREGDAISPYYDPMIAKLIVWGRDREEALARMLQALGSFHLVGLSSNVAFLRRLVASKPFATADLDTGLIARNHDTLFPAAPEVPQDAIALAVAALLAREARSLRTDTRDPHSPWARGSGWRLNSAAERTLTFTHGEHAIDATLVYGRDGSRLKTNGNEAPFTSQRHGETFTVMLGSHKATGQVHADGDAFHVFTGGAHWTLERHDPLAHAGEADDEGGKLTAPMPGKVIAVLATPGQSVTKGAPLVVMEAMKMEHTLTAPADGVVESVLYGVGDQVTEGVQLLAFKPAE